MIVKFKHFQSTIQVISLVVLQKNLWENTENSVPVTIATIKIKTIRNILYNHYSFPQIALTLVTIPLLLTVQPV